MVGPRAVEALTVAGFRSFRELDKLELGALAVIIGPNGAGKSNLVSLFRFLADLVEGRLQYAVGNAGGPDVLLHFGAKTTRHIEAFFEFGTNGYGFRLELNESNQLFFAEESISWSENSSAIRADERRRPLGEGHFESKLRSVYDSERQSGSSGGATDVYASVRSWTVYHFHDTGPSSPLKKRCEIGDHERLKPDGSNLAAMLYELRAADPTIYASIRSTVRLAVPFFEDFVLEPMVDNLAQTELRWMQAGAQYLQRASQLSDGTLRFIALVTALLQPHPPSTLIIDEPELGLHPYALALLGGLVRQATTRTQVIVCTQSPVFLNEFAPEDVIVAHNVHGASEFIKPNAKELIEWLSDYTLGELWQKNLLGGRPLK